MEKKIKTGSVEREIKIKSQNEKIFFHFNLQ